jgi:hypothetical protein
VAARVAARDEVLGLLFADTSTRLAWSGKRLGAGRAEWMGDVERLLDAAEDILRDVVVLGAGAPVGIGSQDRRAELERLARALWPGGVTRCAAAVRRCREQLAIYVQGRAAVDALFATLAEEAAALGESRLGA